jgi:hypothetical protein
MRLLEQGTWWKGGKAKRRQRGTLSPGPGYCSCLLGRPGACRRRQVVMSSDRQGIFEPRPRGAHQLQNTNTTTYHVTHQRCRVRASTAVPDGCAASVVQASPSPNGGVHLKLRHRHPPALFWRSLWRLAPPARSFRGSLALNGCTRDSSWSHLTPRPFLAGRLQPAPSPLSAHGPPTLHLPATAPCHQLC